MRILNDFNLHSNTQQDVKFQGSPLRIKQISIRNYQDALQMWENLKYAKYLDAHQNTAQDKFIRAKNYSFLDKLTSHEDKIGFIEKYCDFTKFPKLNAVCDKIDSTFKNCLGTAAKCLNFYECTDAYDVIDYGYDVTCSLGLRKAFPGSDLDKGYVILRGNENETAKDADITAKKFSGELWHNLDQRIVSLNHPNTAVSVYTKKQILDMLDNLDSKASKIVLADNIKSTLKIIGEGIGLFFGIRPENEPKTLNPFEGGAFNIKVAKRILSANDREAAKNFAFFIETVVANKQRFSEVPNDLIFERIESSPFVKRSNVTQVEAWKEKIAGGYMKSKLRNRMELEKDFYSMSVDTKYDLVKDIIKYATDDHSDKFSVYFKNDDDIAARYQKLLDNLE